MNSICKNCEKFKKDCEGMPSFYTGCIFFIKSIKNK